jgi:hypothetical protein
MKEKLNQKAKKKLSLDATSSANIENTKTGAPQQRGELKNRFRKKDLFCPIME